MRSRYGIAVTLLVAMLGVGCKVGIPQTETRKVMARVVRASASELVVRVGAEQWELKVAPGTRIPADLKEGSLVTVEYAMIAKEVTARPEPLKPAKPRTPLPD